MRRVPAEERFWQKVDHRVGGCWLWTSATDTWGYGMIAIDGRNVSAHRFAYELMVGPILKGWTIDHRHTCPKNCVNPAHLRLATRKHQNENHGGAQANSKSGVRGVYWREDRQRYVAEVRHNRRCITVGYFKTLEEANRAVVAKCNELFTHNDFDRQGLR